MKVYNAKVMKEGVNPKTNKAWTLVTFTDGTKNDDGSEKTYSTFNDELLNVVNGQWVDGVTSQADKDGKTYNNFKMADKQSVPLQFKAVVPEESGADKAVAKAPQTSTVPQDVWEKKDRAMAWMNCNNAAAQLFSGTGLMDEHIKHVRKLYEEYNIVINGKETLSSNFAKVLDQVPAIKPASAVVEPPTPPVPTNNQGEISLDDVPF